MNFLKYKNKLQFKKRVLKFTYLVFIITISTLLINNNARINDLEDDFDKIRSELGIFKSVTNEKTKEQNQKYFNDKFNQVSSLEDYSLDNGNIILREKHQLQNEKINTQIEFNNLIGGNNSDFGKAVVVDSFNNIIITGTTYSYDFPTLNAYNNTYSGKADVFITKLSSSGSLLWSTYLGGISNDYSSAIEVDSFNNIIITGHTESSNFPTLNAYDNRTNKNYDKVFISKFSSDGLLIWSTLLGGDSMDIGSDLDIDSNDNIIVTGTTYSFYFPTLDAYDDTFKGGEAFLTKFSCNGSILWSTFFGGSETDNGLSVAIDSLDNIVMTGYTTSNDFSTINAYDNNYNGNDDSFVAKFSKDGSLLWNTFLGGSEDEFGNAIAVDSSDNVFVTGTTYSTDFPISNVFDSTFNDYSDAFITKFSSNGSFIWSTFLGGNSFDFGYAIVTNSSYNIIVSGMTQSFNFPTLNAFSNTYSGDHDSYITVFASNGSILSSTYLGGSYLDTCNGLAIDKEGKINVIGTTYSSDFPATNIQLSEIIHPYCFSFLAKFKSLTFNSSDNNDIAIPSFTFWNLLVSIGLVNTIQFIKRKKRYKLNN